MKESLSQRFGRCVRQLRLEGGWTQVEFGERCGFYQTYLSRLERGQANPTLNAMEVIANGLGLTIYELWCRVESLVDNKICLHTTAQTISSLLANAYHPTLKAFGTTTARGCRLVKKVASIRSADNALAQTDTELEAEGHGSTSKEMASPLAHNCLE